MLRARLKAPGSLKPFELDNARRQTPAPVFDSEALRQPTIVVVKIVPLDVATLDMPFAGRSVKGLAPMQYTMIIDDQQVPRCE